MPFAFGGALLESFARWRADLLSRFLRLDFLIVTFKQQLSIFKERDDHDDRRTRQPDKKQDHQHFGEPIEYE
jgi:hypothetical protein